jgi:hypothetical protein
MLGVLIAVSGMLLGGCGSQDSTAQSAASESGAASSGPSVGLLQEFRDAAEAGETFDAYGLAIDLEDTQQAAIDAFCVVATKAHGAESAKLADAAYFSRRVAAVAKSEDKTASMKSIEGAVDTLEETIDPESLDPELVQNYAKACYG